MKTLWKRYLAGTLASLLMLSAVYATLAGAFADDTGEPVPETPVQIDVVEEPAPEQPASAPEQPEAAPETEADGGAPELSVTGPSAAGDAPIEPLSTIYTVTLNPNGGSVSLTSIEVEADGVYGMLPAATYAGKIFEGWFTAAEGGTKVMSTTAIVMNADHTLYAHWTDSASDPAPVTYTVKVQKRWRGQTPDGNCGNWNAYEDVATVTLHDGETYDMTGRLYTAAGAWETIVMAGDPVTGTVTRNMVIQQDVTVQEYWFRHSIYFYEKGTNKELTNDLGQTSTGYGTSGPAAGKRETYSGFSDVISGYTLVEMSGDMPYSGTLSFTMSMTNREETRITKLYYTANNYTLTFDANGTVADPATVSPTSKQVTFDKAIGELPTPIRDGYRFVNWYTAAEGGTVVVGANIYQTADDSTVYAHWVKVHTVTFNGNGGTPSVPSMPFDDGAAIGPLPTAQRAGYTLDGWYTAAEGGDKIASSRLITGDTTFFAHWTKTPTTKLTVTFDANGGTTNEPTRQVEYLAPIGELPGAVRSDGYYTMLGWFTAAEGGTKISGTLPVVSNVTYYAHWIKDYTVTVSYRFTNGDDKSVHFLYGPIRMSGSEGYDLLADITNKHVPGVQQHCVDATLTYLGVDPAYAPASGAADGTDKQIVLLFERSTVRLVVKFNAAAGKQLREDYYIIHVQGSTLDLTPAGQPEMYGFTFPGYTFGMIQKQLEDVTPHLVGDDLGYVAAMRYNPNTYTLNYDANGGSVTPASKSVTFDAAVGALATPTRAGYTFDGWFTAKDGGTEVTAETVYTTVGNSTVHAHWTEKATYTVKVQKRWRGQTPDGNCGNWNAYEDVATVTLHDGETYDMTGRLYTAAGAWETIVMAGDPVTGTVTRNMVIQQDVTVQEYWFRHSIYFYEKGTNKELTNDLGQTSTGYGTSGPAAGKKETYSGFSDVISGYTLVELSGYTPYTGTLSFTMSMTNREETRITKLYYTANNYTLNFDANGTATVPANVDPTSKQVTFDKAVGELPTPTRTGYNFVGWFTGKDGGTQVTATSVYKTADDSTVYAHWTEKATFLVTLDPNGGAVSPSEITAQEDGVYGTLPTPMRKNYNFDGWFTEKDGGTAVTATSTVVKNEAHTLYAHWTEKATYTVKVQKRLRDQTPDGAYGNWSEYKDVATVTLHDGESYDMTGKLYTAAGAWEAVVLGGDPVTGTVTRNMLITQDVTRQTFWFSVSISYLEDGTNKALTNDLGQTSTGYSDYDAAEGKTSTYQGFSTTVPGYTFLRATGYTPYTGTIQYTMSMTHREETRITTLYYTANNYTLNFDPNGTATVPANVSPTSKQVTFDKAVGELPTPTRTGYNFVGWFTGKDGGTQVTAATIYTTVGDSTVYAHWTEDNKCTVTFDSMGGTSVPSTIIAKNGTVGPLVAPTKANATFGGWFTEPAGGRQITSSEVVTDDVTFYAHWEAIPTPTYSVTVRYLNENGGGTLVPDFTLTNLTAGSAYDVTVETARSISGYTRLSVDGVSNGVVTGNIVITVWYAKNAGGGTTPGKGPSSPATGESNLKLQLCVVAVLALMEIFLCTLLAKRVKVKKQSAHR